MTTQGRFLGRPGRTGTAAVACINIVTGQTTPSA
jgi:hypothetical protein